MDLSLGVLFWEKWWQWWELFFKYKIGKWIAYKVTQYHMIRWLDMLISNGIMGFNQHFRIDKSSNCSIASFKSIWHVGFRPWLLTAYSCCEINIHLQKVPRFVHQWSGWNQLYNTICNQLNYYICTTLRYDLDFFGFTKSKSVLGYELTVFLSEQKHARTHTHTPFSKRLYIKIHLSSINLSTAV